MTTPVKRPVGRPRQFDDEHERTLIFDAAYRALRDLGNEFTVAAILSEAGVSTRSFYRHFESKDALLCAMYLRDAEWAAARLATRLSETSTPTQAVESWIDEIFGFRRNARRAERVAVLGSIAATRAEGAEDVAVLSRTLLSESLGVAIEAGVADGTFHIDGSGSIDLVTELVAAAVMHAAGLSTLASEPHDQAPTTAFCLRALGCASTPRK